MAIADEDGLPRRDVPPRLQNALLPGHIPPNCRRQRSSVGRTNRLTHQSALLQEATAIVLAQASVQARAVSALGLKRSGSPSLLSSVAALTAAAAGLSETTASAVMRSAARCLTPVASSTRWLPAAASQHDGAISTPVHHVPTAAERRAATGFAEPGAAAVGVADATADMALSAPRRPQAATPGPLRAAMLRGSSPLEVRSAAHRRESPARGAATPSTNTLLSGMERFLKPSSSEGARASRKGEIDPLIAPYVVAPKLRQDITDYHSTAYVTQCPAGTGQYASPAARFDSATRGPLGCAAATHSDKEHRAHVQQASAARRQQRESAFAANAEQEYERSVLRDRANIARRAKARDRVAAAAQAASMFEAKRQGQVLGGPTVPNFLPDL